MFRFAYCFTVTMPSSIYKIGINKLSNEFGKNIPRFSPYEGGKMGFITHLCCVDSNINVEEICKKYNYEMGNPTKMLVEDSMYNSNYTIYNTYNKEGPKFRLELTKKTFSDEYNL
jgi:hypothetical protein